MKKVTIALVAAALSTSPALAGKGLFPTETVTIKVSASGLNLADARDIRELQARVDKAIAAACTPGGVYQAYQVADSQCISKMTSDSGQMVASLTRDAQKSRMAEF